MLSFRFYDKWDLPNVVGAVDGKHIHMVAPDNTGSAYFNYKRTFSLNLMAIADADYRFLMVDVGQMGSISDGGVWDHCTFGHAWNRAQVPVPAPMPLPHSETVLPYYIIGDEAFPLKPNLMRPYPGRDTAQNDMRKRRFNYRLSRARRVIENAFGILANRWRFLFTPVDTNPDKLSTMVYASCVLHNLLRSISDSSYAPTGYADTVVNGHIVEGLWRADRALEDNREGAQPRNHTQAASINRERLADWCSNQGARTWQDGYITRTV